MTTAEKTITEKIDAMSPSPYGVETFIDRRRKGKEFLTVFFRRKTDSRSEALAFPGAVLDGLASAGLPLLSGLKITLTPYPDGRHVCVVEAPLETG